jgi:hypothetical protein
MHRLVKFEHPVVLFVRQSQHTVVVQVLITVHDQQLVLG